MESLGHHHLENNFIISERLKCKVLGAEGSLSLHLGILLSPNTSEHSGGAAQLALLGFQCKDLLLWSSLTPFKNIRTDTILQKSHYVLRNGKTGCSVTFSSGQYRAVSENEWSFFISPRNLTFIC